MLAVTGLGAVVPVRLVRAYLSGAKDGEPIELEDPGEVREEVPETLAYAEAAARCVAKELTAGHSTPTRPYLVQALTEMDRELSSGFLQAQFHNEEGCEVNVTLKVTGSEHRAELEAFHPETGVVIREEVATTAGTVRIIGYGGGIRIRKGEKEGLER